ncbi:MAG TPA: DUF423 domain-containing protein [Pirellulaceae bacterium]|nr:DUF423 domain-containing protein [Pirellulaceae bacterium]
MNQRILILIAALLGPSGIILGAYQAHGLQRSLERQAAAAGVDSTVETAGKSGLSPDDPKSSLTPAAIARRVANCDTAVKYQLTHALAILALASFVREGPRRFCSAAVTFWLLGLAGFSGGLYQIVFTGRPWHWAIVPAGGLLLILGWSLLGLLVLLEPGSEAKTSAR